MSTGTAVVIGGGLIGCSSAYHLARRGWKVTVLERSKIGTGASHGNCGYVCPSHALPMAAPGMVSKTIGMLLKKDSALSIPFRFDLGLWRWLWKFRAECNRSRMMKSAVGRNALLASSMQLYRQFLADENVDCDWQDKGLMLVFKSRVEFQEYGETAEMLRREFDIATASYSGDELNSVEPALKPGLAGAWHFTGDAHVRPDRLMQEFKRVLIEHGAAITEDATVESLAVEAGTVKSAVTNIGEFHADLVVLATGAEAPQFAKQLGCKIPIQPGKGYSITMDTFDGAPTIPMIFEEHHVAVTPMTNRFRVGSTMEFTGYDRTLNRRRLDLLRRSANEHLRNPIPEQFHEEWSGWRPMIYDGLPVIDRAPAANNVIIAAGNGMIGLASAPATGKLVAEIASDETPHLPIEPYSHRRF